MSVHTVAASKRSPAQIADDVLSVIESYRLKASPFDPKIIPQARNTFLPLIQKAVEKQTPISLTLPAFPFKSPNTEDKVLGTLPDKAEEVALKHLQGFCDNIKDAYAPGAELTIVSDGIVYSGQQILQFYSRFQSLTDLRSSRRPRLYCVGVWGAPSPDGD